MTTHFTYQDPVGELQQGDVLQRTESVERLLRDVHPHYASHDYKYLIVLTQSCDLVRRNADACKARYISVAAVRPLTTCLSREAERFQRSERTVRLKIGRDVDRRRLAEFVERLLNNNADGFFYLHPDAGAAFHEPHVAFLALSIAVKSRLHYATCLDARVAQLRPEFQAKLGWLVGHMYSRVGTSDWVPENATREQFDDQVNKLVDGLGIMWLPEKIHGAVVKADKKAEKRTGAGLSAVEVVDLAESKQKELRSRRQHAAERMAEIAAEFSRLDDALKQKLLRRILSDAELSSLLK